MKLSRQRILGVLMIGSAAVIWGTMGFFAKILYLEGVSFEALVAFRAVGGWITVVAFLLLTRQAQRLKVKPGDLMLLVPLGAVSIGAFYLLYFYTIRESTVGAAAVLLYSSPAFVALLAWMFLKEPLSSLRLAALLMTLTGISLAVGIYTPSTLGVRPLVLLTGLGSGLTYGLYSILGKPLSGRLHPAAILSYALGVGAIPLMLAAWPTLHTLAELPVSAYAILTAFAVIHTALAFALYTAGLKRMEAGQAAIVATLEPVVATVSGIALLGEEITALKALGAALVLAGAALAQVKIRGGVSSRPR